jgi:hypothetical protein
MDDVTEHADQTSAGVTTSAGASVVPTGPLVVGELCTLVGDSKDHSALSIKIVYVHFTS